MRPFLLRFVKAAVFICAAAVSVASLCADTLVIGGAITQSTQDGTGPAVNNPSLNGIQDGDSFNIQLDFAESITSPGTFDLTGASVLFSVASAKAAEDAFNFLSMTVAPSGAFDRIGILGCLTTGSGCGQGNELDLSFAIPAANLNQQNVAAQGIPALLPLDLLEDDGLTDIHGVVTNYSYTPASPVPEPSMSMFAAGGMMAMACKLRNTKRSMQNR
jgi:hypothetical protein